MEDRKLTEKESLEVITSMISRTKERYMMGDGNIMLMWGYLILTVTALIWILIATTHNQQWNWLWFAIWIGGIITPIMSRKKQIKSGVKSYSDKIMSRIWLTVGFSGLATTLMCLGFLLILSLDTWNTMFTFALTIVPFAEIAQGIVIREKSFIFGGATGMLLGIFTICCISGNVTLYANWFLPMFMIAIIFMMVIPGHILNAKARRN